MFGVSQGSVLKTVPWIIMVYFYTLWLEWRVVSLALIPHLPVFLMYFDLWIHCVGGNMSKPSNHESFDSRTQCILNIIIILPLFLIWILVIVLHCIVLAWNVRKIYVTMTSQSITVFQLDDDLCCQFYYF